VEFDFLAGRLDVFGDVTGVLGDLVLVLQCWCCIYCWAEAGPKDGVVGKGTKGAKCVTHGKLGEDCSAGQVLESCSAS
jgi:hypothetical protein